MRVVTAIIFTILFTYGIAQLYPARFPKVISSGAEVLNPWSGGLDLPQFSSTDMNGDGTNDLIVFDKKGSKWLVFLGNSNNQFKYAPQYDGIFPKGIQRMGLLRDYNCDGKADIFCHVNGAIQVWKQVTDANFNPSFVLEKNVLQYFTGFDYRNIYKYNNDIPAIEDFDGDGDLDILSFDLLGTTIPFYRNTSVEDGNGCDSLTFVEHSACWGNFKESNSDNGIELNFSCKGNATSGSGGGSRHTGSTLLAFDPDEDNDMDLLLGDVSFNNMVFLTNGGDNNNANMISFETDFPSNSTAVDVEIFPSAFYVDVTGDGNKDIIVSPNSNTLHINTKNAWLYENTGVGANQFQFVQDDFLGESMIDFGSYSYPVLFDHNGDGLEDLIIANGYVYTELSVTEGSLYYFENTGTETQPEFTFVTDNYQNVKSLGLEFIRPTFGDLDDDGDLDMIIGDEFGNIHLFTNTAGTGNVAAFSLTQLQFESIDVGNFSHPVLHDLNEDGLLDLIIGRQGNSGEIAYYWNIGTAQAAAYDPDSSNQSLGGIHVEEPGFINGYSAPYVHVENGNKVIYVGSDVGNIHKYDINIDSLESGEFTQLTTEILPSKVGIRSTLAIADINNDSEDDFIIGSSRGGVHLYSRVITDSTLVLPIKELAANNIDVLLYPNPATNQIVVATPNHTSVKTIIIYDVRGAAILREQMVGDQKQFDVSNLASGLYLVHISDEQRFTSTKLVIQ